MTHAPGVTPSPRTRPTPPAWHTPRRPRTRRPRTGQTLAVLATAIVVSSVLATAVSSAGAAGAAGGRAASPDRAAFPNRPTRVLALGDSVMEGAASAIPAALPGRDVVVDTQVSRSTGATAAAAAAHGSDWDVVAILVGHNDGGSPAAYQPPYRQMLDQFSGVPRVVLLTIHQVRPYYAGVNAFVGQQAARPNVRVADWNAVANANPGATAGDGLHLSGSGARLMAGLIADQVVQAEAAAVPPPTTAPPTTAPPTTVAPTTTAPATTTTAQPVILIPATSVVQATPSTTSTTSTLAPRLAAAHRPRPIDDDGTAAPAAVWPGLALAMAAATFIIRRLTRHFPT